MAALENNKIKLIRRKSTYLSDLKIKRLIFLKYLDDILTQIFPNSTPGDYNGPLGYSYVTMWIKRVEKKDMWKALVTSLFMTPVGWIITSQDSQNILGWISLLGGWSATIYLFLKGLENDQKKEKIVQNHEQRITKLEQLVDDLRRT